uniref:Uncharacterized protein n=1 Tax=Amphimedon queenslandica TaxID=400682 RepID=A0A1X7TY36_AMPQE
MPSTSTAALHESNIQDEEISLEDKDELSEEELPQEELRTLGDETMQTPDDLVQAIVVDCSEPCSVSGTLLMIYIVTSATEIPSIFLDGKQ